MCGVCGYIGTSKNPHVTYELITTLFEKTESRGEDASGYWGVNKSNIIYHKEPIKSSKFVQKDCWKELKKFNPDLLLVHARAASAGSGLPSINKNNHPFISSDKNIGLIHNGKISETDYKTLKKKYEVLSECDSELYLRIFESNDDRTESLKTIWSVLGRSQMAVAIGERLNDDRRLWLFRNKWRSLWLADLRHTLGQIFFFSTPDIWEEAVWLCEEARSYIKKAGEIEIPTEEIWQINYSKNEFSKKCLEVKTSGVFKPWNFDGQLVKIPNNPPVCNFVTHLGEDEEPKKNSLAPYIGQKHTTDKELYPDMSDGKRNIEKISILCKEIKSRIDDIETGAETSLMEDSMSAADYDELVSSLEGAMLDLEGTVKILDNLHW